MTTDGESIPDPVIDGDGGEAAAIAPLRLLAEDADDL